MDSIQCLWSGLFPTQQLRGGLEGGLCEVTAGYRGRSFGAKHLAPYHMVQCGLFVIHKGGTHSTHVIFFNSVRLQVLRRQVYAASFFQFEGYCKYDTSDKFVFQITLLFQITLPGKGSWCHLWRINPKPNSHHSHCPRSQFPHPEASRSLSKYIMHLALHIKSSARFVSSVSRDALTTSHYFQQAVTQQYLIDRHWRVNPKDTWLSLR